MTQRGYRVITILPIKSKMATAKKQCFVFLFFAISVYKGTSIFFVGFLRIVEGGGTQAIIENLNLKKLKGS